MSSVERRDTGDLEEAWPFYLVVDVSASMWKRHENDPDTSPTPYAVIVDSVPQILAELEGNPAAIDKAHFGVLTFSDQTEVALPLTPLSEFPTVEVFPQGLQTDYAMLFHTLRTTIDADVVRLTDQNYKVLRPAVFLLTDGEPYVANETQPPQVWEPHLDALYDPSREHRPTVIAIGFGQVGEATLCRLASVDPPGAACIAEDGAGAADLLRGIAAAIMVSITKSTQSGSLVFEVPARMRLLDCG